MLECVVFKTDVEGILVKDSECGLDEICVFGDVLIFFVTG